MDVVELDEAKAPLLVVMLDDAALVFVPVALVMETAEVVMVEDVLAGVQEVEEFVDLFTDILVELSEAWLVETIVGKEVKVLLEDVVVAPGFAVSAYAPIAMITIMTMTTRATATMEMPVIFLGKGYFFNSNKGNLDLGIYRREQKVLAFSYRSKRRKKDPRRKYV